MGTTTKTLASTGADYTTITAWEAATVTDSGTNVWEGVISEDADFDPGGDVTFATTETINASAYQHLTVGSAYRHPGHWDATKARVVVSPQSTNFNINEDYVTISWLQIVSTSGNKFAATLYITSDADQILFDGLILGNHANGGSRAIGIWVDGSNSEIYMSNSHVYGWHDAGLYMEASTAVTSIANLDHCTITENGHFDNPYSGNIGLYDSHASGSLTVNMSNCDFVDAAATAELGLTDSGAGTTVLNGSHNCRTSSSLWDAVTTDNTTDWVAVASGHISTTGTADTIPVQVWDTSRPYSAMDLRLRDDATNNKAQAAGTNRQGSEPDARQDFSIDIAGATRPTTNVDIGAFQISAAGAAAGGIIKPALSATRQHLLTR